MLSLTGGEETQVTPVQSQNLDLVSLSNHQNNQNLDSIQPHTMEIEMVYSGMIQQIKELGTFCRGNWATLSEKINDLQTRNTTIEVAVTELVTKDIETTKLINEQIQIIEAASQTFSWLKLNIEEIRIDHDTRLKSMKDWIQKISQENDKSLILTDIRKINIARELMEDRVNKLHGKYEGMQSNVSCIRNSTGNLNSKVDELEAISKKTLQNLNALEDKLLLTESRVKETQKRQESLEILEEKLREKDRNVQTIEESFENLKKKVGKLEEELRKHSSSGISKNEKSLLSKLDLDVTMLKDKTTSMEVLVDHLNDITYEDFARRFKKEVIESTDTHFSKLAKEVKQLEDATETQRRTNDSIQKNLLELKKKVDVEALRTQDTKHVQISEDKWKENELKFDEISSNLEILSKKIKTQEGDILGLSANVYDYSFKEMATSFEERMDNKILPIRQQIKELHQHIKCMEKNNIEENHSNILIDKIQKMVELKLNSYTSSIDQKFINLGYSKTGNLEVPTESMDGKQILYKAGDEIVDPNCILPSIDGTFRLREGTRFRIQQEDHQSLKYADKPNIKFQNRGNENSLKESNTQKKCRYNDTCPEAGCPYAHTRKTCGGFRDCKKPNCKRRHHPDRDNMREKTMINTRQSEVVIKKKNKHNDNLFPYPKTPTGMLYPHQFPLRKDKGSHNSYISLGKTNSYNSRENPSKGSGRKEKADQRRQNNIYSNYIEKDMPVPRTNPQHHITSNGGRIRIYPTTFRRDDTKYYPQYPPSQEGYWQ